MRALDPASFAFRCPITGQKGPRDASVIPLFDVFFGGSAACWLDRNQLQSALMHGRGVD